MTSSTSDSPTRSFRIEAIARRLGVSHEELRHWLDSTGFQPAPSNSIDESRLDECLVRFGVDHGGKSIRYEIPTEVKGSADPWKQALVRGYEHSCAYPACLSPEQGQQVHDLILENQPSRVLEIGCFMGVSSVWIAAALQSLGGERHLHSLDLFDPIWPWPPYRYGYLGDPHRFAHELAIAAGLENRVTFHRMSSFDLASGFDALASEGFDFAFVDGDHSFGGCLHDVAVVLPRLCQGGVLLLHDIYPEHCGWEGPRRVLDEYLIPSTEVDVQEIETEPRNYGMAVIRKLDEASFLPSSGSPKLRWIRTRSRLARSPLGGIVKSLAAAGRSWSS